MRTCRCLSLQHYDNTIVRSVHVHPLRHLPGRHLLGVSCQWVSTAHQQELNHFFIPKLNGRMQGKLCGSPDGLLWSGYVPKSMKLAPLLDLILCQHFFRKILCALARLDPCTAWVTACRNAFGANAKNTLRLVNSARAFLPRHLELRLS